MTKICSISTIRKKVREYGKKINAPSHLLTIRTSSDGFGTPHIEINKKGYNHVDNERGTELERRQTNNLDKVLYWILKSIVFSMACDYELEHRNPKEDFRSQLFAKQIELMEQIDSKFALWEKEDLENILKGHPYEDN